MAGIQVLRFQPVEQLQAGLAEHTAGRHRPPAVHKRDGYPAVEVLVDDFQSAKKLVDDIRLQKKTRGRQAKYNQVDVLFAGPPPFDDNGQNDWDMDQIRKWSADSVRWLQDKFPSAKIYSAAIHCDETAPHLHVSFVPVNSSGKINWTGLQNDGFPEFAAVRGKAKKGKRSGPAERTSAIQSDYYENIAQRYGLGRGNIGSDRSRGAIDRLKAAEKIAREKETEAERNAEKVRESAKAASYFGPFSKSHRESKRKIAELSREDVLRRQNLRKVKIALKKERADHAQTTKLLERAKTKIDIATGSIRDADVEIYKLRALVRGMEIVLGRLGQLPFVKRLLAGAGLERPEYMSPNSERFASAEKFLTTNAPSAQKDKDPDLGL